MLQTYRALATASVVAAIGAASPAYAQMAATPDTDATVIAIADWTPDITRENAASAEEMLDADVYGADGEEIGEVENIIVGADGRVLSLVAEVGGFWDIGDTHTNIPWEMVEIDASTGRITLPITEETIGEYSYFEDEVVSSLSASVAVGEVSGDGPGAVQTGPAAWRISDLIGDSVRLQDGDAYADYGVVDDAIIQDGAVSAVLMRPGYGIGTNGLYAVPFIADGMMWNPGMTSYDLPYAEDDVAGLTPMDDDMFDMD